MRSLRRYPGGFLLLATCLVMILLTPMGPPEQEDVIIGFQRGVQLDTGGSMAIVEVAAILNRYPDLAVVLEGHSGVSGDADANLLLSEARVRVIHIQLTGLNISPERISSVYLGGTEPLPQEDGESTRGYDARLARVVARFME